MKEKDGDRSSGKQLANPTYTAWLLAAIRKIKQQKQRPSVERITHAVRQYHNVSPDSIEEQLDLAVRDGSVLKVHNKGVLSYKDPSGVTSLKTRHLKVSKKTDLTKIVIRSIKELGHEDGSTAKSIEKYIRRSYTIDADEDSDISHSIRISIKRAVNSRHLIQEGRQYKVHEPPRVQRCISESSSDSPSSVFEQLRDITANEKNKVMVTLTITLVIFRA